MSMETAIAALEAYGYRQVGGLRYVRLPKQTQQWEPCGEDGFLRYDDPGAVPVPYRVRPESEGVAGISHADPAHAEHFDWLWPAGEVERIYAHAAEQAAKGWPTEPTEPTE